jgi:hypothetical protein
MVEGASTAADQVDLSDLKNQPLEVRRQTVGKQLSDIHAKLLTIHDKTRLALDRLSTHGIDTAAATLELDAAAAHLVDAKMKIASFTDPTVSFIPTTSVPTPLRDAVLAAETSLRTSREHILQTLIALKAAIGSPLTQ